MELTYLSRFQFKITSDGIYSLPAYGDGFWRKYLDVFDTIRVIGEPVKSYLDNGNMVKLTDERVNIEIVPSIEHPKELINYFKVKNSILNIVNSSTALIIKPASNKGIMAINICKRISVPYMIEVTGDVKSALMVRKQLIMKLYAGIIYKRTVRAIKDCKYGLYVTEDYLQKKYPIGGIMCGCTDVLIPHSHPDLLHSRIMKIQNYDKDTVYKVGLIGFYHDNNKGIDTAIKALGLVQNVDNTNVELHILGVGNSEDREYWKGYARRYDFEYNMFFDTPLAGASEVVKWIDSIDIIILPSRSEGFPRAIAEAMSRACPVITSNVCGLKEMAESKWQHTAGNYRQMASLLNEMIKSKDNMVNAAKYNYSKAQNYLPEILRKRRNKFLVEFKNSVLSES